MCGPRSGAGSALAAKGGFRASTVDEILVDPTIDVVLVLTPPAAHAPVAMAAIAAGKHVYTEKPLATSRADARRVLEAAAEAGVRVGAAPDTFLGGGLQTARALIDERSDRDADSWRRRRSPIPDRSAGIWTHGSSTAPGGGPVLDVGPYYVTALVNLLGPVRPWRRSGADAALSGSIATGPLAGTTVTAEVPTTVHRHADLRVGRHRQPVRVLRYGRLARTAFRDPRDGGIAQPRRPESVRRGGPLPSHSDRRPGRTSRCGSTVRCRTRHRPRGHGGRDPLWTGAHRASGELAYHVLDVLLALEAATTSGRTETIASRVERPAAARGDGVTSSRRGP